MKKGITLIALIITIIVLLILAGISISLVMGDNGILSKAQKSKKQTVIGDVKDTAEIIRGEYEVDNKGKSPTSRYIIEKLIEQGKITSSQVEDYGDDTGIGIIIVENENVEIRGSLLGKTLAWTCNNGNWSDTIVINENDELNGDIVAKLIPTDNTITPPQYTDYDEVYSFPSGTAYRLEITGSMEMPDLWADTIVPQNIKVASVSVLDANPSMEIAAKQVFPEAWQKETDIFPYITSVTINEGITNVSDSAFQDFISLQEVYLPNSITTIERSAFSNCRSLREITIPNSVRTIESWAFSYCESLENFYVPAGVEEIDDPILAGCDSLRTIVVDNNNAVYDSRNNCNAIIKTSDNRLENGCKNTIIPNTITAIGQYAFQRISTLESIYIPASVTNILCDFYGCKSLSSIVVDENNSVYDSRNNCNAVIETASNSLRIGCKNTVIPNGITEIIWCAFKSAEDLTSINIPSSVTTITSGAFSVCSKLETVHYGGTQEQWNNLIANNNDYCLKNATVIFE